MHTNVLAGLAQLCKPLLCCDEIRIDDRDDACISVRQLQDVSQHARSTSAQPDHGNPQHSHAAFFAEIVFPSCFRVTPSANSARQIKSRLTSGDACSSIATRDWLESINRANCIWVIPEDFRTLRSFSISEIFRSINSISSSLRPRNSCVSVTRYPRLTNFCRTPFFISLSCPDRTF